MAKLTDAVKREIVQRLARFESPKSIIKAITEGYGAPVTPRQVSFYDPSNADCQMSDTLRELFRETRERYLHDRAEVPSTRRLFRVRRLEAMAMRAEERNPLLAMKLYEQIAKEEGGMFKNKNLPQAAAPPAALRIEEETDEERRARETAAAASYDRQRRGELSEDDAA